MRYNKLTDIAILSIQVIKDIERPKQKIISNICTKDSLYDFIKQFHLNEYWARNWYEWHIENGFKDQHGNKIANWRGALLNYCKSKPNGIIKKGT